MRRTVWVPTGKGSFLVTSSDGEINLRRRSESVTTLVEQKTGNEEFLWKE